MVVCIHHERLPGWWKGIHSGLKIRRPFGLASSNLAPGTTLKLKKPMRTYLNLEVEQLVTLLAVLEELELSRDLTRSEKYVRELVKEGLDRARQAW